MDIKDFLSILGILATLTLSVIAVYKAFRTAKTEVKSADVDLSTKYDELLDRALARSKKSEDQLKEM